MKPKLYESGASFGKNELTSEQAANQNYLQFNYQFKFRYLNENAQPPVDKSMEPIDLSLKRTSPSEDTRRKAFVEHKPKEIDKQNGVKASASQAPVEQRIHHSPTNSNSNNEAKLLPYLLLSGHSTGAHKPDEHRPKAGQPDEPSSTYAETDLSLKYNKKKLFLASVRKRKPSSSTDNSNQSTNGAAFSSSSSSSSNSPNSTPSSSHTSATHQLSNSDRRNSSSSTTSSTNISSSPNSDTTLTDDLDHQQPIKEFDLYQAQRNLLAKDKLFDSRLYSLPNSFAKKFEYFAKHYKLNESRGHKPTGETGNGSNGNHCAAANGGHPSNGRSSGSDAANGDSRTLTSNGSRDRKPVNRKPANGQPNDKPVNGSIRDKFSFFNMYLKSFQKCNSNSRTFIGLKRSLSESYLMDQKQEITLNLLTYKRRQLKRWNSENDLIDLYRCNRGNRGEQSTRQNDQTKKEETSNRQASRQPNDATNRPANGQSSNGLHHQQPVGKEPQLADYRQRKLDESKVGENEMKRQLIDKQISKEQEFYLRDQQHMKDGLVSYTKMLIRNNQKTSYPLNQFGHFNGQLDKFGQFNKFDEFDKFNPIKPSSLPLNMQLNRSKASLTFNNSQLFTKKPLINGQCNKINEKTGKRKFTKLASDEDEEDLEEDDENEENIIVDNLSNSASTSVSPSSIQSNSDSSINNKLLLAKHHLDQHGENGLDLRLPFINHPSHHLASHLNGLSGRRPLPGSRQSGFGPHPNDLLQSEAASLSASPKDDLTSWKFYKDYYYLLLNQPDSPAKLNALQWLMKDLNEKNNNHVHLNDDWSELELVKLHAYKPSYPTLEGGGPLNLTMFNGLSRPGNPGVVLDQSHRQLLNTSRLDKFTPNSPQAIGLANMQLTPENYLQYVKMNEGLLNGNRHLTNGNQLQILTGQSYLNLENGSNHCLPAGTPNSFQDRKRISRPLTGRHVRQGTGASPTTLANLRSMIKERQKFREINGGLGVNGKKFRKKRK